MRDGDCVYMVDTLGWGEVTLVVTDGTGVEIVPISRLPRPLRVGTRLHVPLDADGRPIWPMARLQGLAGFPELAAARGAAGLRR